MEYVIHLLVENDLDFSGIEKSYKHDDTGRPAIDPRILFKIILLAYSKASQDHGRSNMLVRKISFSWPCPDPQQWLRADMPRGEYKPKVLLNIYKLVQFQEAVVCSSSQERYIAAEKFFF